MNQYQGMEVAEIITAIALETDQGMFVRAHKLNKGLIESLENKTTIVETSREEAERDLLPHLKFDGSGHWVKVPKVVVAHNLLSGKVTFVDGTTTADTHDNIRLAETRKRTPIVFREGWWEKDNGEWTNAPRPEPAEAPTFLAD